ncbi:hypothetical protein C0Q70_03313 [Pomacea canaliculata]|uniref:NAD(P)H oxidase (H(2)O(2)-forming) n=1 Tax=Pomacea canaliculata TaxID=400727 RepID=A0A2T7PSE0_POMCA|nr:hypothetical protein C0Q70_03313 [Pomacea canaliculata]
MPLAKSKKKPRVITKDDEKTFAWMEKQFRQMAGSNGSLDKEAFKKAFRLSRPSFEFRAALDSFFADRFFQLFDNDNSGSIDLNELLRGLLKLTRGSPTDKLRFLFRVYDVDSSGTIDREELGTVLRSCMEESSLVLSEENLQALTDALFDDADADKSGEITFEKLKDQLEKHPGVMQNLTISAAKWLVPRKEEKRRRAPRHLSWTYIRNNLAKVICTIMFVLINMGLYALNAWLYRYSNWYIIFARGAGMCLHFNCAFGLFLMLRKSLTLMRNTPLARILPFDQHVMFHKMAGFAVVFFTLIHTAMHLANAIFYLQREKKLNLFEILFTLKAKVGWFYGFAPLSGVILDVILLIMFICSMEFVRRSGCFEVFYWTHKLYIPFYVLNILHATNFWKWIVGPGAIFLIECLIRLKMFWYARQGDMRIQSVKLLPSGVTQLIITRPSSFNYKPGDYVFLNIPAIAKYEWHPFTISSAPQMSGTFWIHVRSAGHWTRSLYKYFEDYKSSVVDAEEGMADNKEMYANCKKFKASFKSFRMGRPGVPLTRRNTKARRINASVKRRVREVKVNERVYVDGPYGTPSRHIFEAEHAVLIGSGIGVTPFASILQSIMYRFREAEVDFVWINRDQRNFEWFLSLLTRLESEQSRDRENGLGHVLDMHMYMTSALSKADMKGIGLQMALDLIHEAEQTDLITGLQTRTQPGRPDFDKLFSHIANHAKGKVKVFFCGSPLLGKVLKEYSHKYEFGFSQEIF